MEKKGSQQMAPFFIAEYAIKFQTVSQSVPEWLGLSRRWPLVILSLISLNPKEAPQPAVFFPESPFKVGEGLQEAPHLQGFTVPAGEAFFSFPVDGLHRFSPVPADEAQPSVGSPTSKDSPLDRAGKERVKVGSPASAKIHPHRGRSAPLHRGSPHP